MADKSLPVDHGWEMADDDDDEVVGLCIECYEEILIWEDYSWTGGGPLCEECRPECDDDFYEDE